MSKTIFITLLAITFLFSIKNLLSNPNPALTGIDQHMVVINTPYTLHHDIYRAITVTGGFPLGCPLP